MLPVIVFCSVLVGLKLRKGKIRLLGPTLQLATRQTPGCCDGCQGQLIEWLDCTRLPRAPGLTWLDVGEARAAVSGISDPWGTAPASSVLGNGMFVGFLPWRIKRRLMNLQVSFSLTHTHTLFMLCLLFLQQSYSGVFFLVFFLAFEESSLSLSLFSPVFFLTPLHKLPNYPAIRQRQFAEQSPDNICQLTNPERYQRDKSLSQSVLSSRLVTIISTLI